MCLVAQVTDENQSAQAKAMAVTGTHAQIHCPHVLGWVWDTSILLLSDVPVSGGLWWSGREWYTCLPESGPMVAHPFIFLLRFLSSLVSPWVPGGVMLRNRMSHLFCNRIGSASSQLRVIAPFTYRIINITLLFFFLPAVYCWKLVWSEPVNHEASNKKVMKSRGLNLTALVAFLHEGRCRSLPSLEIKLLPTAGAGGQWDLHIQVNK